MSNIHSDYKHEKEFIPALIAHTFHRVLDIIQDASHNEGDLKLKVDHYVSTNKSTYIYQSCVYQILEIIVWFKKLKDAYSDEEQNKLLWTKLEKKLIESHILEGYIVVVEWNWILGLTLSSTSHLLTIVKLLHSLFMVQLLQMQNDR